MADVSLMALLGREGGGVSVGTIGNEVKEGKYRLVVQAAKHISLQKSSLVSASFVWG